jgi:hypothetical protein
LRKRSCLVSPDQVVGGGAPKPGDHFCTLHTFVRTYHPKVYWLFLDVGIQIFLRLFPKTKWLFLLRRNSFLVKKIKLLRLFLGSLKARAPPGEIRGLVYLLDPDHPLKILQWLSFLQPAEGSWLFTVAFQGLLVPPLVPTLTSSLLCAACCCCRRSVLH